MNSFDKFTREELEHVINTYHTWSELLNALGIYRTHNKMAPLLKKKLDEMHLNYSGLDYNIINRNVKNRRNLYNRLSNEEVFCLNDISSSTVRRRFREITEEQDYICSICHAKPIWNGKLLVLVMDHIDGNNRNNELSNLRWLCPNCNSQTDTFCGHNKIRIYKKERVCVENHKDLCPRCGRLKDLKADYCLECHRFLKGTYINGTKQLKPSRNELKSEIRESSFESIGRKYGVSGNAVKKWCKLYGLPFKKSEINSISDKDWKIV